MSYSSDSDSINSSDDNIKMEEIPIPETEKQIKKIIKMIKEKGPIEVWEDEDLDELETEMNLLEDHDFWTHVTDDDGMVCNLESIIFEYGLDEYV